MNDADDEDDEEAEEEDDDTDDDETNDDAELTEDSFRDGTADKVAPRQPQHATKVPPIGLASQNLFSKAAGRGEARASSAHTVPPAYQRGSSRSGYRAPLGSDYTAGASRDPLGSGAATGGSARQREPSTRQGSQARQRSSTATRVPLSETQRANQHKYGLRPDREPTLLNPNQLPLTAEEWKIARETQAPALMARIEYERTHGRNVPIEPTSAAYQAQPDKQQVAMAKQLATVYASLAPLTGGQILPKNKFYVPIQ